jgi:hypothetical protein
MILAPIAIFAFNRPRHLERLLISLVANEEAKHSKIFVFVDGPRKVADEEPINLVLSTIERFKSNLNINLIRSVENKGLSASVLSGIDFVLESNSEVIVLEDDLVLANSFLKFCNQGLNHFRNNPLIASIQGYSPILLNKGNGTYFLRGADCWGWATWRDRWQTVERNSGTLLDQLEGAKLSFKFDLDGSFPYTEMLRREFRHEVDSWAIRWHASMFLQNRLSVYPNSSLVLNTGFDGSGTHKGNFQDYGAVLGFKHDAGSTSFRWTVPKESKVARSMIIKISRHRYKSYPNWHPKGFIRVVGRKIKRNFNKGGREPSRENF